MLSLAGLWIFFISFRRLGEQNDPSEFLIFWLSRLEPFTASGDLNQSLSCIIEQSRSCAANCEIKPRLEIRAINFCNVRSSFLESLTWNCNVDEELKCSHGLPECQLPIIERASFYSLPRNLVVSLKRYKFDATTMKSSKISVNCNIEEYIDLDDFCCKYNRVFNNKIWSDKYKLLLLLEPKQLKSFLFCSFFHNCNMKSKI